MTATFIKIGEPAHDAERQALRFLVEGLPDGYVVYGNPWLVERSGALYELDAVVVAPHAFYVVEIKGYRGTVEGNDHDWYVPGLVRSPLGLNRKTAQVLATRLKRESWDAGQPWVEGFVFLPAASGLRVDGQASRDRVHGRKTILGALVDEALVQRLSGRQTLASTAGVPARELERLLKDAALGPRPRRSLREYEIEATLDHQERFAELLGKNRLSGDYRVLRVYGLPPLASDDERRRIVDRARWEAQVLGRLGKSQGILHADPPIDDEAGIVLPFEHFPGVTLSTWIDRYGPNGKKQKADLKTRTDLWLLVAAALRDAHAQGVVHRLLRPEVVLVEDSSTPRQVRVTGFDLAKQLAADTTVSITTLTDERLQYAAPEVVSVWSAAEPASDQFGLGALLGLVVTGFPLFGSTRHLMATGRLMVRARDLAPRTPGGLDAAISKMLALRPTDRFPSLKEAMDAVWESRSSVATAIPTAPQKLDPEALAPGTRIGTDYEITGRLGQGGMAVVYAARHIVSGRTRALKISRAEAQAEELLRGEYEALCRLDHPNIVKVIDLSKVVEGRLTLVMERVGGESLRQWLARNPAPAAQTLRRYAEDLLAALGYLEQQGVVHKDLKPDNLLVGDAGLTVIDFSLARLPAAAIYGGTALYRDPGSVDFCHASDRYAAALCLFELYAGRHAFDGRVPEPGQAPLVRPEDIDPPGLAELFRKALAPVPEQRFPSAAAMRQALLIALGAEVDLPAAGATPAKLDAKSPIQLVGLSPRAVNQLVRSGITSVGELLGLSEAQVRAIHAIGSKTASDVLVVQAELRKQGIEPVSRSAGVEPALHQQLASCAEPLERLSLPQALLQSLDAARVPTIGALAGLTRSGLLHLEGIGPARLAQVVEALAHYYDHASEADPSATLDRLWERASSALTEQQRAALSAVVGLYSVEMPPSQAVIAQELGLGQPAVSNLSSQGRERLDPGALAEPLEAVEALVDGLGGMGLLVEIGERCEERWPAGQVRGAGLVRLLVRISGGRLQLLDDLDGTRGPVVARPSFDRQAIRAFVTEVLRLAQEWPPLDPGVVRRSLAAALPITCDPLSLAVRLVADLDLSEGGHLFIQPLDPKLSVAYVLAHEHGALTVDGLLGRVREVFGERTPLPDVDHLLALLGQLDYQVKGDRILPAGSHSVIDQPGPAPDAVPDTLLTDRPAEEVIRDRLREDAHRTGFVMLVTPPERHAEIGRSVARSLGATWLSFEEALFARHGHEIDRLERAERFKAQHALLTELGETLLSDLLEEHGRPGAKVVLGDTALLKLLDLLEWPRLLYDESLSGRLGFWVLVVPGVIHKRQPRFNEGPGIWHLPGATFPLIRPIAESGGVP